MKPSWKLENAVTSFEKEEEGEGGEEEGEGGRSNYTLLHIRLFSLIACK